ncbi:hypothetical protein WJX73_004645 [Symbiochloris irregularis]|uniref:Uncharacterized protein n=1 Tax=Symbiochloris irregularis TaxID=706552 RepID=A0AAW1PJB3_9CHLO
MTWEELPSPLLPTELQDAVAQVVVELYEQSGADRRAFSHAEISYQPEWLPIVYLKIWERCKDESGEEFQRLAYALGSSPFAKHAKYKGNWKTKSSSRCLGALVSQQVVPRLLKRAMPLLGVPLKVQVG